MVIEPGQPTPVVPGPSAYMQGLCHVFAVALHRESGSSFLLLVDEADDYPAGVPAVVHVYARPGDGTLVDAMGVRDEADAVAQWLDGESGAPAVRTLDDEDELAEYVGPGFEHPLADYDDGDIERAAELARALLLGAPRPLAAAGSAGILVERCRRPPYGVRQPSENPMNRVEITTTGPVGFELCEIVVADDYDRSELSLDHAEVERARDEGGAQSVLDLIVDNGCGGDILRAAVTNDSPVYLDGEEIPLDYVASQFSAPAP